MPTSENLTKLKRYLFKNQNTNQTILKNTFWAFLAEGVKKCTLLFLSVLIARYLGVSAYGKFSFALSFTMLFSVFSDLGLTMLTTREVARSPELVHKYTSNIITVKLLLGVGTFVIITLVSQLTGKADDVKLLIYVFSGYVILNSVNDFFVAIFRAYEEIQYEALFKIIQSAALLLLVVVSYFLGCSAVWIVSSYVVSRVVGLLAALCIFRKKKIVLQLSFEWGFIVASLRESWPFALSTVFYIIYFSIDTIMISFLLGDREVGIYSASYVLISGLFYLPFLLSIPFFPRMSKLLKGSGKDIRGLLSLWNRNLLIAFVPVFIFFFVFSNFIIGQLYGSLYSDSVLVFQLLLLSLPFKFLSHPPGYSLSALNLHRTRVSIQGGTALFNIVANYILIPIYGLFAACGTTLMSCFLLFILYRVFFNRFLATRDC